MVRLFERGEHAAVVFYLIYESQAPLAEFDVQKGKHRPFIHMYARE